MKVSVCSERPILTPCGLKDINYQVDPYIGCEHYCYYCYALPQAETDWAKEVLIYNDIVGQLAKELEKIPPQTVYMGYQTDPYQPCEAEYFQTRKVLELFLQRGFSATILTKSDLVVRDIEILREMDDASVSVSVAFNDNQTRRSLEANTIDTEKRIEALKKIKEADVRTGALMCPIIPYVTDAIQMIDILEPYADVIWIYGLSINDPSSQNWLDIQKILHHTSPELISQIESVIFSKDHRYWGELKEKLEILGKDRELNLNIHI